MREECKNCIYECQLAACACLDLRWAWYELMQSIPKLKNFAKKPEECYLKEVDEHVSED